MTYVVDCEKCMAAGGWSDCPGGEPQCNAVCPLEGTVTKDPINNCAVIDAETCADCEVCVDACPGDAIAPYSSIRP